MLQFAEQTEDALMKAEAMRKIAMNKDQTGNWEDALESYKESLSIVQSLDKLTQIGLVYNNIGYVYFERSDLDEAMKYFQKALKIGKQSGDNRLIGDVANNLGMIASLRGGFDEAIKYYEDCVVKFEESDDWHGLAQAYQNLGVAYFRKGMLEKADEHYRMSLEISEKRGIYRLITYTSLNRAEVYLAWPDLAKAKSFCDRAFEILSFLDDKWARAEGQKYYGMIYKCQHDFQSAKRAFRMSLEVSEECAHLPNMAEVHCEMGAMYKEEGELGEALAHFSKSREIFQDLRIAEEVQRIDGYIDEIRSE
jgi:protein O-GlcNAc transferase